MAKGSRSGVAVGEVKVWGQGERSVGEMGGRDSGYKQRAEVKRHKNKSSHLEACYGPALFLALSTWIISEVSEYSQQH